MFKEFCPHANESFILEERDVFAGLGFSTRSIIVVGAVTNSHTHAALTHGSGILNIERWSYGAAEVIVQAYWLWRICGVSAVVYVA